MADHPTQNDGTWARLRTLTAARIGLARAGASLATVPLLEFKLAHARARDAVHETLDQRRLVDNLSAFGLPVRAVASAAEDRQTYLMRPDLGRRLASDGETSLKPDASTYDIAIVIVDGLSARAVQLHAQPLLVELLPGLRAEGWRIAPLVVVRQGRVAIGDTIARLLGA